MDEPFMLILPIRTEINPSNIDNPRNPHLKFIGGLRLEKRATNVFHNDESSCHGKILLKGRWGGAKK